MNRFERWMFRRILKKEIRQGFAHDKKITELYREINDECRRTFYEDNVYTRNEYLREWFEDSLDPQPVEYFTRSGPVK